MKCNLDKNSMNLLKSIGFEFRRSHDNEGETLDAYRTAKGKYEWIMCLGKKEATEGYQYRYFVYKNRNDMLLGRKAIKDVDFKDKKELLDYFKLKATASAEKVFAYKGKIITASSKEDAINKILSDKQPVMERVVAKNKKHLEKLIYESIDKYGDNCDLNFIDVSNVTDMSELFRYSDFNGDISKWDVSNVRDMAKLFWYSKFNGDISKWNVSNVRDMRLMFTDSEFNGDISKWNVSKVKNMSGMFWNSKFNGDISKWNVSNVRDMRLMFRNSKFNGDILKWIPMMKKNGIDIKDLSLPERLANKLEKKYKEL